MSRDSHYCRECMGRCELVHAAYEQGKRDALLRLKDGEAENVDMDALALRIVRELGGSRLFTRDDAAHLVKTLIVANIADLGRVGEIRMALEGMVAAFDNNDGDADVRRITRECAMSGAKRVLGWPATAPTESSEHECRPCGYHSTVCCQCRSLLSSSAESKCEECHHNWVDKDGFCLVDSCGPSHRCVFPTTELADDLVDEAQKRMDSVVERAVEWHQAGREGAAWFDKAEALSAAIDSLLELRSTPAPSVAQPACPHCNNSDCQCSDFDVSPDMGAKG